MISEIAISCISALIYLWSCAVHILGKHRSTSRHDSVLLCDKWSMGCHFISWTFQIKGICLPGMHNSTSKPKTKTRFAYLDLCLQFLQISIVVTSLVCFWVKKEIKLQWIKVSCNVEINFLKRFSFYTWCSNSCTLFYQLKLWITVTLLSWFMAAGPFGRGKMQKAFEKAVLALKVGEMSDVVDTDSGVHIILRTGWLRLCELSQSIYTGKWNALKNICLVTNSCMHSLVRFAKFYFLVNFAGDIYFGMMLTAKLLSDCFECNRIRYRMLMVIVPWGPHFPVYVGNACID